MRRLLSLAMTAGLCFAGWKFFQNFSLEGLAGLKIKPQADSGDSPEPGEAPARSAPPPAARGDAQVVRIASFNIQVFGESKIAKPEVVEVLVDVVRRFDLVAIQEIRTKNQDLLPRFVELLNAKGRHYDYVIGPRLGRTTSKEQYAFVFDAQSIEVDRVAMYTLGDPGGRLHRPPLVTPFRVRGPPPNQAFTFTLMNIHTDPDEVATEVAALAEAVLQVRNDGRNEDDVILLGDLNADHRHFGALGNLSGIAWTVQGVPTNTRGSAQYDNIVFHAPSTTEFTGRSGVFDLMRQYNLTQERALEISDHLPIWAEFSLFEGGQPGRVAKAPETPAR